MEPRADRRARARYGLVGGAILLSGGFVWLGMWQLDRAAEKHALFHDYELRSRSAVALEEASADPEATRYHRLRLTGRYDEAHQFLIDNIVVDGRVGYYVLTPLRRQRGEDAVLVNRGWLPAGPSRDQLPDIDVPARLRVVDGLVDRLPRPGLRLAEDDGEGWPRRVVYPELDDLAGALGYALAPFQLLLAPEAGDGYRRDWRPRVSPPQRHFGYAVQWFALAATVAVVCAVLVLRRSADERRP